MSDRVIHGSDHPVDPDSVICQWLRANDVDPSQVPHESTVTVTGGEITYEKFALPPYQPDPAVGRLEYSVPRRELCTVPLISPPEAHGL